MANTLSMGGGDGDMTGVCYVYGLCCDRWGWWKVDIMLSMSK
jgi:hypothetical protein